MNQFTNRKKILLKVFLIILTPTFFIIGLFTFARGYFLDILDKSERVSKVQIENVDLSTRFFNRSSSSRDNSATSWGIGIKSHSMNSVGEFLVFEDQNYKYLGELSNEELIIFAQIPKESELINFYDASKKFSYVSNANATETLFIAEEGKPFPLYNFKDGRQVVDTFFDYTNAVFWVLTISNQEALTLHTLTLDSKLKNVVTIPDLDATTQIKFINSENVYLEAKNMKCMILNIERGNKDFVDCQDKSFLRSESEVYWKSKNYNIFVENFSEVIELVKNGVTFTQQLSAQNESISNLHFDNDIFTYSVYSILANNLEFSAIYQQAANKQLSDRKIVSITTPPGNPNTYFWVNSTLYAITSIDSRDLLFKYNQTPLSYSGNNWEIVDVDIENILEIDVI